MLSPFCGRKGVKILTLCYSPISDVMQSCLGLVRLSEETTASGTDPEQVRFAGKVPTVRTGVTFLHIHSFLLEKRKRTRLHTKACLHVSVISCVIVQKSVTLLRHILLKCSHVS
jgi:hypothetical protein